MRRLVIVVLSVFMLAFMVNISLASEDPISLAITGDQFQLGEAGFLKLEEDGRITKTYQDVTQQASIHSAQGTDITSYLTDGTLDSWVWLDDPCRDSDAPDNNNNAYYIDGDHIDIEFPEPIILGKIKTWGHTPTNGYHGTECGACYVLNKVEARNQPDEIWHTVWSGGSSCCELGWRTCEAYFMSNDKPYKYWRLTYSINRHWTANCIGANHYIARMAKIELLACRSESAPDSTATAFLDFSSYETVYSISFASSDDVKYLFKMDLDNGNGNTWYYFDNNDDCWKETSLEEIGEVGMNRSFISAEAPKMLVAINTTLHKGNGTIVIAAYLPSSDSYFEKVTLNVTPLSFDPEDVTFERRYKYSWEPGEVEIEVKDILTPPRPSCEVQAINIDYGDGNTEQVNPGKQFKVVHTYAAAGEYTAKLTVNLGCNLSTTVDIPIVISPRAGATFDISKKIMDKVEYPPMTCRFTANVSSKDERNLQLDGGVTWTIKKDGEVVAVLEEEPEAGKPPEVEYTFEEGGTYSISASAKSIIGTDITTSKEELLSIPERAEATFNIKARKRSAYVPAPFSFSAALISKDKRNRTVAGDISWTITREGDPDPIAQLTGEKPTMQYTFEEEGTYNILVEADTAIGTHATGSSTVEVLPRAEVNLNAEIRKRFFPGRVTIRPSLSSEDKRNKRISSCTLTVFDPDGNPVYNETEEKTLPSVTIDLNEKPGNYIARVSVVTSIGTEATKDFPFEFVRAPASAAVTVKVRHRHVPAEIQIRRKIASDDSRNRFNPAEERYEVWYHDGEKSTLIDTIPLSPENRGRITYTLSSPGTYTVKYLATSQIGTEITGESPAFEIKDAAPITVTIKPSCRPGIESPVPVECRFAARIKSKDPRNKKIVVSQWEVYKGDSDVPVLTVHKEGKEALRFKRFACRFTEPGTYTVKYIPTMETGFSPEGTVQVVALEAAAVDAEIISKCRPPYAPSGCTFRASIVAADKRDKLSSCQWKVYKGNTLLHETEPSRSTRLRYSFEEGGQYTVVFSAQTKLGKAIEKQQVVEIGDRMPVTLEIIPKPPRFNRPPATYRFSFKSVSEDKRQRSIRDISVKILNPQGEEVYSTDRSVFSYTFNEPGCYAVTAQAVTKRLGTFITGELPVTIEPNQLPEITEIRADQNRMRPMQYKFSVRATDKDGKVRSYHWDFADGGSADRKSVKHEYAEPGTYTVSVTVCDDSEGCSTAQTQVHVGE